MHGDLSQAMRDTVMQKFRVRNLQILVATDVAARGLDVNDLTHVINYNLPDDVEVYTHRSGRTGRANKKGVSVSIIHQKEKFKIKAIERMLKRTFEKQRIPNGLEVCKKQLFFMINKMQNVVVEDEQLDTFFPQIMSQLEYLSKEDIIKRFVSLEFNRFLEYYKGAPDLNIEEHEKEKREKKSSKEKGDKEGAPKKEKSKGKTKKTGEKIRLKVNIGERNGVTPKRLLGMINDLVGDRTIGVSDIEITNKFTFFDVYVDQYNKLNRAFEQQRDLVLMPAKGSKSLEEYERGGRRRDDFFANSRREERRGNGEKPWRRERKRR